jgi:predicted RNA-binding protein YlqC (UPF0109 family)
VDEVERLVLKMVCSIVDTPGDVSVESVNGDGGTTYHVRAALAEMGQLIGKQGRTARALRTILAGIAMKEKRRITLDIVRQSSHSKL